MPGNVLSDVDLDRFARMGEESTQHSLPQNSAHIVSYATWQQEVQKGIRSLLDAQDAHIKHNDRFKLSTSSTGLALVLHYDMKKDKSGFKTDADEVDFDLVLVQWVLAGKSGRIADLDAEDKIIAIVPSGKKRVPIDFSNSSIVHPATGIQMERVKKQDRPKLPQQIKRLMDMWRVALQAQCMSENIALQQLNEQEHAESSHSLTADAIIDTSGAIQALDVCLACCVLCGSNHHHNVLRQSNRPNPSSSRACSESAPDYIQQCSICLLFWHRSCSERMLRIVTPGDDPNSSMGQQLPQGQMIYMIQENIGKNNNGNGSNPESFSRRLLHRLAWHGSVELPTCFRRDANASTEHDRRQVLSCVFVLCVL